MRRPTATSPDPAVPEGLEPADPLPLPAAPARVLRVRRWTVLYERRGLLLAVALVTAVVVLVAAELTTGYRDLSLGQVWQVLRGQGAPGPEFSVYEVRLPRALTAVLVGLALGATGAAFQTLVGNPLGSPDVVGLTAGSATGAVLGLLVVGGGQLVVAGCSVAGGLITAAAIYLLARSDGIEGYRLVLLGVGIAAVLTSLNAWLISRASLDQALAAQIWLTGTLHARGWEHVVPLAVVLVVTLPLLAARGRELTWWRLGTDTAATLGVRTGRVRLWVVGLTVITVAVATTATGPVMFVALVAPHLHRLLAGGGQAGVVGSALTGATLLLASDVVAQHYAGDQFPVGVVTSIIGGGYLAWLLTYELRRSGR